MAFILEDRRLANLHATFSRTEGERHDYARGFLSHLPEDVLSQISVLLCLEPGERALLDLEFHDPAPTRSSL